MTLLNDVPSAQRFYNIFCLIESKLFNDYLRVHLGSILP